MATNTNKTMATRENQWEGTGTTCPFEQVDTPGCYVVNQTGTLLRVPQDGLIPGRSPAITVCSNDPWTVTKISCDPFIARTKARMIAADYDLNVNF